MTEQTRQQTTVAVFKRCPRCHYSLSGLPSAHSCPECGLRYDEECELFRAVNPKQILIVWAGIIGSGIAVLQNLPHLFHLASASVWQRVGAMAALAWFFFVGALIWSLVQRYRRGFEVALTADGLIVRLPAFHDELIPWDNVTGASIKERRPGKPQIASLALKDKPNAVDVGGVANVFPNPAVVQRFVQKVNERIDGA